MLCNNARQCASHTPVHGWARRAAVLHNISKLTVPKEHLLTCNSGSNNNPLFSFLKDASLRTLVVEGNAEPLGDGDDGSQLLKLLLPQPGNTLKSALGTYINLINFQVLELGGCGKNDA
eukprot:1139306-Pelagomonas_calceolata.AAC.4